MRPPRAPLSRRGASAQGVPSPRTARLAGASGEHPGNDALRIVEFTNTQENGRAWRPT